MTRNTLILVVWAFLANGSLLAQSTNLGAPPAQRGMFCPTASGLAKAYWQKANDHFGERDLGSAILFFQKAIAADSTFCDAFHGLSIIYSGIAKPDSAEYCARKAYTLHQSDKLKFNLATMLGMNMKYAEASDLLETLVSSGYQPAATRESLAQMYLYQERFEGAIAQAEASIALCEKDDPELAGLNNLIIGSAWLWQQKPETAKLFFQKALDLGVAVPESYRKAAGMQ